MHSHDTFPTNRVLFFSNPREDLALAVAEGEEVFLSSAAGHNGPCFAGLAQRGYAFNDAQSVRDTRVAGGQVLGQLF